MLVADQNSWGEISVTITYTFLHEGANMPVYQHVLVALDLSIESEALLQKAVAFATQCEARISLIHVVEQARTSLPFTQIDFSAIEQEIKSYAQKRMGELAHSCAIPQEDCIIELGVASQLIHEFAEELDVDLIFVGSHGRHGISLLLGSTANAVLHGARCDVLAVRIIESSRTRTAEARGSQSK